MHPLARRASAAVALVAALVTAPALAGPALAAAPEAQTASSPHSAAAVDDVTWTVRTESNRFGSDRPGYDYTLSPGETITDGIVVTNRGDEQLELGVYAADGFTTDAGGFDLLPAGEKSATLGTWVHLDDATVTVAPGASVTVPFTVVVPENATPGDYGAGVVTSMATAQAADGVSVDRRLGIRMRLRVDGELAPALTVQDVRVDWAGGLNPFAGDTRVEFTLHNAGNTALTSVAGVSVAGPFGMLGTDAAEVADPPELLPGESWTQEVTVPGIAALVLLTATATVIPASTDAAGTTSSLAPVAASGTGWAVPWLVIAVLVLIAAAIVLVPRLRRRRAEAQKAREDARVEEAVAAALAGARES